MSNEVWTVLIIVGIVAVAFIIIPPIFALYGKWVDYWIERR